MTDFDEFLRKRNEERSATVRDIHLNFADQGKEWQWLKDELRRITEGRKLGTEAFEWPTYPAPYPDFLTLGDVAVVFATPAIATLAPQIYRLMFVRRPFRANEVSNIGAPIPAVNWLLSLQHSEGVGYWIVKEDGLRLPTPQFAVKIAERLVEYFDSYTAALRAKYPGFRF